MVFYNYAEENNNEMTKIIHELLKNDSFEKVLNIYKKIPENEKTSEQARCVVSSLIFLERIDEARLLLDKYEKIGIDDEQWNTQYGWTYYIEKKFKEAIPYFVRVEDLNEHGTMLGYLRQCYIEVGNTEEAKRIKKRILELHTLKDTGDKYKKENYYKNNSIK